MIGCPAGEFWAYGPIFFGYLGPDFHFLPILVQYGNGYDDCVAVALIYGTDVTRGRGKLTACHPEQSSKLRPSIARPGLVAVLCDGRTMVAALLDGRTVVSSGCKM